MSALDYCMRELYNVVPRELLQQAYLNINQSTANCPYSNLDTIILDTTFYGRIFADLNIVGGREVLICSEYGTIIHQDANSCVFHFTDEFLAGHSIISALAFFHGMTCINGALVSASCGLGGMALPVIAAQSQPMVGGNILNNLANRLAGNIIQGPQAITTPRIVAHNSILLDNLIIPLPFGVFKVLITHDDALNDLSPRSWPFVSKLFITAVKAYMYQTLRHKILRGSLYYGQEYNVYADILPEYSTAEQEYQELRMDFAKVAYVNDKPRYASYIRNMTRPF